mmetsp:Transcript_28108/g.80117  ORF Transcript_28108/g.80117 Transcript_28108/m.80117 type:complete len:356 (-) Transcript_28108:37-1104(-)
MPADLAHQIALHGLQVRLRRRAQLAHAARGGRARGAGGRLVDEVVAHVHDALVAEVGRRRRRRDRGHERGAGPEGSVALVLHVAVVDDAGQGAAGGAHDTRFAAEDAVDEEADGVGGYELLEEVVGEADGVLLLQHEVDQAGDALLCLAPWAGLRELREQPLDQALGGEHEVGLRLGAGEDGEELRQGPQVQPLHEPVEQGLGPPRAEVAGQLGGVLRQDGGHGAREVASQHGVDVRGGVRLHKRPQGVHDLAVLCLHKHLEELVRRAREELHRDERIPELPRVARLLRCLSCDVLHQLHGGLGIAQALQQLLVARLELLDDILLLQQQFHGAVFLSQQRLEGAGLPLCEQVAER